MAQICVLLGKKQAKVECSIGRSEGPKKRKINRKENKKMRTRMKGKGKGNGGKGKKEKGKAEEA